MAPTLLVADESTTVRRVVDLIFAAHGIAVVGVSDGQQAVEYLSSTRPDVALVSVSLPKLDGFHITGFVRSQSRLRGLPVLLVAGAFDAIEDERARAAGAAGVLYKPLEPEVVIARVKELMALGKAEAPAAHSPVAPPAESPLPTSTHDAAAFHLDEEWFAESDTGANSARVAGGGEAAPAPLAPLSPLAPPAGPFGPAEAFAVLLAEEQGEVAPPVVPQPIVELSDTMVERIADRVAERLMQSAFGDALRDTVHSVSERLVREEIQRIRSAGHPQGRQ